MILLELFSGIGGFRVGLEKSGFVFDKVYFSEIDKHAIANYLYNFKDSENVGSVTNVSGTELRRKHPKEQFIVTFGWPCQDNSIAGKRKGQVAGTRSFLLTEAVRIIRELQPDYFVAENVKGLYSVNDGVDFRDSLGLLSYLDTDNFQYIVEQQLCNTSWLLPQNRERTYFVGYSAKRGWKGVFPITEVDFKPNESVGQARHSVIIDTNYLSRDCKVYSGDAPTVNARDYKEPKIVAQRGREEKCLTPKRTEYGKSIRKEYESGDIQEKRKNIQQLEPREDGLTNTLTGVQKDNMIILAPDNRNHIPGQPDTRKRKEVYIVPSLQAHAGQTQQSFVRIYGWHENENVVAAHRDDEKRSTVSEEVYHKETGILTTMQTAHIPKIISHYEHTDKYAVESEICPTLKANSHGHEPMTNYPTLHGFEHGTNGQFERQLLNIGMIRRLTETECERLQGYEDSWTAMGNYDGIEKKIPKTQRYKLIGNAVTTDIVALVGKRMKEKLF